MTTPISYVTIQENNRDLVDRTFWMRLATTRAGIFQKFHSLHASSAKQLKCILIVKYYIAET